MLIDDRSQGEIEPIDNKGSDDEGEPERNGHHENKRQDKSTKKQRSQQAQAQLCAPLCCKCSLYLINRQLLQGRFTTGDCVAIEL